MRFLHLKKNPTFYCWPILAISLVEYSLGFGILRPDTAKALCGRILFHSSKIHILSWYFSFTLKYVYENLNKNKNKNPKY